MTTVDHPSELTRHIPTVYSDKSPVCMATITNETFDITTADCFFNGNILFYNGRAFTEKPTPLTYLDQIFWMYLIMYAVLTIFAGTVILTHYLPISPSTHISVLIDTKYYSSYLAKCYLLSNCKNKANSKCQKYDTSYMTHN